MKILLLGEYSGVHTNLSNVLRNNGFDVTCIHDGDGYKKFNADYKVIYNRYEPNNKFLKKMFGLYYIFLGTTGIRGSMQILKYRKLISQLKEYDVVQLINPIFLSDYGVWINFFLFLFLKKNNKKIFLCALGDDYFWIKASLDKQYKYSMFDRLSLKNYKNFLGQLQWVYNPIYKMLNKYIAEKSNAVIPGLYDYYASYKHFSNCSEVVPIIAPIFSGKELNNISYPINIFHGWQFGKEMRKGNDIFDEVLLQIKDKYKDKVNYEVVGGLPYDEYIKKFENAHIFIDQCYSYDYGVNALLGMSAGKAVFSGMEEETRNYYELDRTPLVNATPDKKELYHLFKKMIENPRLIEEISIECRIFLKKYHSPKYVLAKYQEIWKSY